MLSHLNRDFRQVEDLAAFHPGDRPARQASPAAAAAGRLMPQLPVRPGHLRQRIALMPVLPARLAAGLLPQRPRRRLAPPRWTAAGMSSAASASAGPQAQRSAPGPAPAPQAPGPAQLVTPPAPSAARPPARPAPHLRNHPHHQAHPDATTTQDLLPRDPASSPYQPSTSKVTPSQIGLTSYLSLIPPLAVIHLLSFHLPHQNQLHT
jgi:hypothetical protein